MALTDAIEIIVRTPGRDLLGRPVERRLHRVVGVDEVALAVPVTLGQLADRRVPHGRSVGITRDTDGMDDASYQHLIVKRDGDITTVTLDRPEKRNALAVDVMEELTATLEAIGRTDARGVVLAANGPVFSAGHNFGDMAGATFDEARHLFDVCTRMMDTVQAIPQPVCAKVHALATAAGCQLVAVVRPGDRRRVGRLRHRRAARAASSATRRWSPWPATSAASGRWRWPSPATPSTPPPRPSGASSTGPCPMTSSTPPSTT